MGKLFSQLDRLLRGEFTKADELREGRVPVPVTTLLIAALLCGALYGVSMGLFAATGGIERGWQQFISSATKVPLLFLFTLIVTFPSLYVFGALAGSRLRVKDMLRLLVASIAVNLAVLASFGPVTVFFTVFTTSYAFISLLNVIFFILAGVVGLGFLSRAVHTVFGEKDTAADKAPKESTGSQGRARMIFRVWILIYGVVGAQMGWILRPFIGNPELEFVWLRHHRESNFFAAMMDLLRDIAGGW
jgi:hypothetical protein